MSEVYFLNGGFIRYIDHMGDDLRVVNAARVSFNKKSDWKEVDHKGNGILSSKDSKLINYLAEHDHWTPFAHPQITLHIKCPIAIRAQLGKHQIGLVMNEISRRYVSYEPDLYYPYFRSKPTNGAKQGSDDYITDVKQKEHIDNIYRESVRKSIETYDALLEAGVAPEQARFVLPQGVYTEWYWTGSLAAYARIYIQRIHPQAQWEVREFAKCLNSIISPLFPESWNVLTTNT